MHEYIFKYQSVDNVDHYYCKKCGLAWSNYVNAGRLLRKNKGFKNAHFYLTNLPNPYEFEEEPTCNEVIMMSVLK